MQRGIFCYDDIGSRLKMFYLFEGRDVFMDLKGNITMEESMMARQKLPFAAILIPVCIVLLVFVISLIWKSSQPERLTEDQIAALRSEYPICGRNGLADAHPMSLEESKENCQTFVYGEVKGDAGWYEEAAGRFNEYTLTVLDDSEEEYPQYHTITIATNSVLRDYNPEPEDGMRVVVPVSPWEGEEPGRMSYSVNGMFYVTDDGYAIPAFEEREESERALSGLKVEKLLKALKK